MVTKVTFVGDNFTRKPPKFERFIRPMGLRMNKVATIKFEKQPQGKHWPNSRLSPIC